MLLAVCRFSALWRIEQIAGSALPQTKHIPMQLASVAARTDRRVQLHREALPINEYYWLDTQYAPRVLQFSAFHFVLVLSDICGIGSIYVLV